MRVRIYGVRESPGLRITTEDYPTVFVSNNAACAISASEPKDAYIRWVYCSVRDVHKRDEEVDKFSSWVQEYENRGYVIMSKLDLQERKCLI